MEIQNKTRRRCRTRSDPALGVSAGATSIFLGPLLGHDAAPIQGQHLESLPWPLRSQEIRYEAVVTHLCKLSTWSRCRGHLDSRDLIGLTHFVCHALVRWVSRAAAQPTGLEQRSTQRALARGFACSACMRRTFVLSLPGCGKTAWRLGQENGTAYAPMPSSHNNNNNNNNNTHV